MFLTVSEDIVWEYVRSCRHDLYNYLLSLSTADWNKQSLYQGWLVRDVVAHLIILYNYQTSSSLIDFIRCGFRINKFLFITAKVYGKHDKQKLLSDYKKLIEQRSIPFFVPPLNALVDTLIHEQDIRIPLGHNKPIKKDLLKFVFINWKPKNFNIGERITGIKKRTSKLHFSASDLTITYGSGLKVIGNAQDILLAIAGRKTSIARLHGDGVEVLRKRLNI